MTPWGLEKFKEAKDSNGGARRDSSVTAGLSVLIAMTLESTQLGSFRCHDLHSIQR